MEKIVDKQSEKNTSVWPIVLLNISLTNKQLIEELKTKTPEERAEIFAEFQKNDQENSWAKKEIQAEKEARYAALRPEGLDYAPQITQEYRKKLEGNANIGNIDALLEMEFFQWKFSYNADGTVNLLKLEWGKTFCADLTGNEWVSNWDAAKELADSKWYHLLTDYNSSDSEIEKTKTDWYKLEEYFGEYTNTWAITYMLGCIGTCYWTDATYEKLKDVVRIRGLTEICYRDWGYKKDNNRVCGFKKMNIDA